MRVYYDRDADVNLIKTKKVVIVGYGSQGHAHANNLKDSGAKEIVVALKKGSRSAPKAEAAGLKVMTPAEAAAWGDVIMILTPDELQGDIYSQDIAPHIRSGAAIETGIASCRERVCQYVSHSVFTVSLTKKQKITPITT